MSTTVIVTALSRSSGVAERRLESDGFQRHALTDPQVPRTFELDRVSVDFAQSVLRVPAVSDVTLTIGQGEFVALLGPSGCGKSTLLNVLAGFQRPTSGVLSFEGRPHLGPTPRCGIVFQKHSLFPWMTVLENVAFGPKQLGLSDPIGRARRLLDLVGLRGVANAWPQSLSGGMQQRVGIARALATEPPVLLMDEPFGALDAQTRSIMQEELLSIWETLRPTIVFVTHDIDEAILLSDRILVMTTNPGRIAEEIHNPIERPRDYRSVSDSRFAGIRERIAGLIRSEARKAFQ